MSVMVSKSVFSMMKRKKVAKETNELKSLEAAFKQVKVVKLSKR